MAKASNTKFQKGQIPNPKGRPKGAMKRVS